MTVWLFNNNDSGHRGVWHIVDPLQWKDIPPTDRTYDRDIWVYHKRGCAREFFGDEPKKHYRYGYRFGGNNNDFYYEQPPACTCGRETNKKVGSYTMRQVAPGYSLPHGNAICGQVYVSARGGYDFPYHVPKSKEKDGAVIEVTPTRVLQNYLFEGEIPPGPYCSRCLKKAEKNA